MSSLLTRGLLLLLGCSLVTASTPASSTGGYEENRANLEAYAPDKCTSIIVSKGAGKEGPMTTHTADCAECDFRINKVPAADWPEGSKRVLYQYRSSYPATVVSDRGKTWHPDNLEGTPDQINEWKEFETSLITGEIPQVRPSCLLSLLDSTPVHVEHR